MVQYWQNCAICVMTKSEIEERTDRGWCWRSSEVDRIQGTISLLTLKEGLSKARKIRREAREVAHTRLGSAQFWMCQ